MSPTAPSLALVTCAGLPALYGEEAALPAALSARGIDVAVLPWDDASADWSRFDAVVIRSTWDYFERYGEFCAWLDRVAPIARLHNSPALLRWNSDKQYLLELAERGVRIVPTEFVSRPASLVELSERRRWSRVVVKPAVSGGAYRTHLLSADDPQAQVELDELLKSTTVLVQPFFPEVKSEGEFSLLFFDGRFSHALVKRPVADDYRVQMQFGGVAQAVDPAPLLAAAEAVMAALPEPPAYARIDGLVRDGDFYLMEAELIEPYLFLHTAPPTATTAYVDLLEKLARC